MNLIRSSLLAAAVILVHTAGFGQRTAHMPGQLLVSLAPESGVPKFLVDRFSNSPGRIPLRIGKKVSDLLNVWLFEIPDDPQIEHNVLEWFRQQPEVRAAQYNHLLENRQTPPDLIPDDPLFSQQWQHLNTGSGGGQANADLDSDLAWNITTGGTTALGDTIVVAVIDGGLDAVHEDLAANLWKNVAEIPDDQLDNDGNGYVDDYRGWNVYAQNDNIAGSSSKHGTPVSAIIGANGNNGVGVTGINWNVKIMFVAGNDQEAAILASYDYVLKARKRYNATNGQQGAFVVAVNCSWGVTYGQPSEAPLWCAAFDSLGKAGILGVAATANTALDVDLSGDLPTACPSDYLISVTSLDKEDQKAVNAAWGLTTIDLGAYGQDIFTAGTGNLYGNFAGTSFAAPEVSGAIGLLYASPCSNLAAMARANPAAAAEKAKTLTLASVLPNPALQNITHTGGRLNLYSLLQNYEDQCVACLPPFALETVVVKGDQLTLSWSKTADVQSVSIRWRMAGTSTWNLEPAPGKPFQLSGLSACTGYEFSMRSNCGGTQSNWSTPVAFKTADCCEPPSTIQSTAVHTTSATLTWNAPAIAKGYQVRMRPAGGTWQIIQSEHDTLDLTNLSPCTLYEVQVQTWCDVDSLSDPLAFSFVTAGCGPCTDLTYCNAKSASAKDEWIKLVQIGSWSHASDNNSGYLDLTGQPLAGVPAIPIGTDSLPLILTPGFSGIPYLEYFRVFIDYSGDGDFDDPDELAFDPGFSSDSPVNGMIYPPPIPDNMLTRMRVLMKYKGPSGNPPAPCETFEFGQVRDYCIQLGETFSAEHSETEEARKPAVYPQPAQDHVFIRLPDRSSGKWSWQLLDLNGRVLNYDHKVQTTGGLLQLQLADLPDGMYVFRLEAERRVFLHKVLKIK